MKMKDIDKKDSVLVALATMASPSAFLRPNSVAETVSSEPFPVRTETSAFVVARVAASAGFYSPEIPSLSHLQFTILANVSQRDDVSGIELRQWLTNSLGQTYSGPAFYQLMRRIEEAGLVQGHYVVTVVNGTPVKERRYRIEVAGREALKSVLDFYGAFQFFLNSENDHCPESKEIVIDNSDVIPKPDHPTKPTRQASDARGRRKRVAEMV